MDVMESLYSVRFDEVLDLRHVTNESDVFQENYSQSYSSFSNRSEGVYNLVIAW